MSDNTSVASDVVSIRLTLNVAYLLSGESAEDMRARLQRLCEHAIGNGMLTGDSAATVDDYAIGVSIPPKPMPEHDITELMRQCIESGDLHPEDIPKRLARYGLMAPDEFVSEMRERTERAADDGSTDLFGVQP